MKKKGITMMAALLMLALIPMIVCAAVLTIRSSSVIGSMVEMELETQLHTTVEVAARHFIDAAESGDGTWVMDGDTLTLGGVAPISREDPIFSSAEARDVYQTLFVGDTRYGTSIKDESGKPVINTKASDVVIEEVLKGGQNKYIKSVDIVGQDFAGYYIPIKDKSGQIVGMMFAGRPRADVDNEINKKVLGLCGTLLLCVIIFGVIASFVAITVTRRIKEVDDHIAVLAEGNFANPIHNHNKIRELSEITGNLEGMRQRLAEAIGQILIHAENVGRSASDAAERLADSQRMTDDINNAVNGVAQGASSMAGDVQATSDLMVNIGDSIDQVLSSAAENLEITDTVFQNSIQVQQQVERLKAEDKETDRMAGEVQNSVAQTADMVNQISQAAEAIIGIASETNLLALNASIEAARAGEAGRGFAVVADNIKNLAEESDKTAKEITEMLSGITALSNQNKNLTEKIKHATGEESIAFEKMSTSFDEMEAQLQQSEEGSRHIEELIEKVNSDKESIISSIENLTAISEENAASAEESGAALTQLTENMDAVVEHANQLQNVSSQLLDAISFFRIN